MYKTMTHLQYPTHAVHIAQNQRTGRIQCFKYNQGACEFEEFDTVDSEEHNLADYIIQPIPAFKYGFVEDNEQE
jgi:hypothetical protein